MSDIHPCAPLTQRPAPPATLPRQGLATDVSDRHPPNAPAAPATGEANRAQMGLLTQVSEWALSGGGAETAAGTALARASGVTGARAAAGGFVTGQLVTSAVENVVKGFVDTDPARWQGQTTLLDRLIINARESQPALRDAVATRNPLRVAGGLFAAAYRGIGADLRAVVHWFLGR